MIKFYLFLILAFCIFLLGITNCDLLIINKIDLAELVGADLEMMKADAESQFKDVEKEIVRTKILKEKKRIGL